MFILNFNTTFVQNWYSAYLQIVTFFISVLDVLGPKTVINNIKPSVKFLKIQILDLAENRLEDMVGLSTLSDLNELNLAANRIRKIGPELEKLKKLSKLDLSGNPIESLIELNPLRNLFNLTQLNIAQNIYPLAPICKLQNYQLQIFYTLQSLTSLDGEEVSKRIVTEAIKAREDLLKFDQIIF